MLDSMIKIHAPTRAEAGDVLLLRVLDGTDALLCYPVESARKR